MKSEIACRIFKKAHLTGEFKLRSGLVSNEYFDKYLFESEPKLLLDIVEYMKGLIPEDAEIIAGLEMGGIPVVTALSIVSNKEAVFVRKHAKEYGTCKRTNIIIKSRKVEKVMKKKFKLQDLDCANCAAKMEDAIKKIDGVQDATVSFMTQKMTIEADDARFDDIMKEVVSVCKKVEPDCVILM